jgi:hypothetical protein
MMTVITSFHRLVQLVEIDKYSPLFGIQKVLTIKSDSRISYQVIYVDNPKGGREIISQT